MSKALIMERQQHQDQQTWKTCSEFHFTNLNNNILYYKKSWHFFFLPENKIPGWRTPWGGGQTNRHTCVNDISVGRQQHMQAKWVCISQPKDHLWDVVGKIPIFPFPFIAACQLVLVVVAQQLPLLLLLHLLPFSPKTNSSIHPPSQKRKTHPS